MSKKNIHPESHTISIVLNNGTTFQTKSCAGKEGDVVKLEIDPTNHQAWRKNGTTIVNTKNNQIAKFNKKFADAFEN